MELRRPQFLEPAKLRGPVLRRPVFEPEQEPGPRIFGTKEWADYSRANIIIGCAHDCWYCYAKAWAIRFHKNPPDAWKNERLNVFAMGTDFKHHGTIMYPSSHDITPQYLPAHIEQIRQIGHRNKILIVTKPHLKCVKAICKELHMFKGGLLFRFTIGSASNKVLKFWEPGAPPLSRRLEALKWAYNAGFATSVSAEPMLDTEQDYLFALVRPLVTQSIWFGLPNMLMSRLAINQAPDKVLAAGRKLLAAQRT